ncbi:MAG: PKD domain-containing protein [Flavobacteriales bacterium]|nr:PKD domain-containing protein [Flavobacteriales bacterium]MCB9175204.1 PKD domain-containing protein [Flavobacteriales bacterium]
MKTKFTILLFLLLSFQIGKSQLYLNFITNFTTCCEATPPCIINFTPFSPANIISWHWDFGDGDTSILEMPSHAYSSSGFYTIILIASDGIVTDTLIRVDYIMIFPKPIVDFIYNTNGDTVQFFDQSSNDAALWDWDLGNGTTTNVVNPITTYPFPPDSCYDVTLSVINNFGCMASLTKNDYICINSTTSINELKNNSISIYPSPIINNQKLTVKGMGVEKMVVYDVLGSLIRLPIISKNENEIIFETNQLNKGVYFLQLLFNDGSSATKKIIVQ